MRPLAAALWLGLLATAAPAAAQTPSQPGPWAIDARGITSPVPEDPSFYPPLDNTALLTSRGFGLDVGAHVYLFSLGAARVGVGANVIHSWSRTRPPQAAVPATPTTPTEAGQEVRLTLRMLAPQLSFNFGTGECWSYLSGGVGTAAVTTRTSAVDPGRFDSGRLMAINVGGGARWFLTSRVAFGFDVRFHRVASGGDGTLELAGATADAVPVATPGMTVLVAGLGFSFR